MEPLPDFETEPFPPFSAPLIELDGLIRMYGDFAAVRGISLSIPGGEVFGLLGPNGAGKSTTLKMLATLLLPSGGTARIAGRDLVTAADAVRRTIGYVPRGRRPL